MYFYPNECYVCESTASLQQCSFCKMVSYCGEPHQKIDWKNHKTFCKAISNIIKKNGLSHIFEGLKGMTRHKWMEESKNMWPEIILLLNRAFFPNEEEMLQFPRVCFICFEARQEFLQNCPNCPFATFCQDHPSSPIHDKNCLEIKMVHDKKVLVVPSEEIIQTNILLAAIKKSEKPPISMEDFMEQKFGPECTIDENIKYYVSEAMSVPLTLYNSFLQLNRPLQSEIVIHVQGVANVNVFINSWESLLHLLPSINSLTIVFIDSKQNSCTNVPLCNRCSLSKKKVTVEVPSLPYVKYVKKKSYKKPNMLAMFMMDLYYCSRDQFIMWHENLDYWTTSYCPIIIAYKANVEKFVVESVHPYIWNSSLYYMGLNSFAPLYPCLNPYDWTCCRNSMNLIISKSPRDSKHLRKETGMLEGKLLPRNQEEDDEDDPDESVEWKRRLWKRSFYHSVCYVCQSMNPTLACKKCKMIFYCGENHQRVHWPHHKSICRIILGMLNETGATTVFDQLKIDDDESWLKAKIDLLTKVELKIGKQLLDGDREMFLFPKTCFICHASDSSILKNCKCGVSFCKFHLKNPNHKEHCKDFSLSRKLMMILEPRVVHLELKVLPKKSNEFPSSMEEFIKLYLKFNSEELGIPNIQNILLSDYLSRPLTFLYCAERLIDPCYFENDLLVIHVIGSTMREKYEIVFWKLVLFWFDHLKNLRIVFVGPEAETQTISSQQTLLVRFDFSSIAYMRYQNLEIKSHPIKYEDYYRSDEFIRPDIIVGFNLNMHESELETWKETVSILTEIQAPFIMTAKSKARSRKDEKTFSTILGDSFGYSYGPDENLFASFIPERDFETEGLCYSNKLITICSIFYNKVQYKSKPRTAEELEKEMLDVQTKISQLLHESKNGKSDKKVKKGTRKKAKTNSKIEECERKEVEKLKTENPQVEEKNSKCEEKLKIETKEKEVKSVEGKNSECSETLKVTLDESEIKHLSTETLSELKNDIQRKENILLGEGDKQNFTKEFPFSRKFLMRLKSQIMLLDVKVLPKKNKEFSLTMNDFLKDYLEFNSTDAFGFKNIADLLSAYLSRPLTFLYCAERLIDPLYLKNDPLVIHVIGSPREKYEILVWKFVLFWLNHLKNLTIVFIGPEAETLSSEESFQLQFDFSAIDYMCYQNLEIKSHSMKYEDYYRSKEFILPNVIIGFDLDLHESKLGTWEENISILNELNVPFVMTSTSKICSNKDDKPFMKILGDTFKFDDQDTLNFFASFIPESECEMKDTCFSNKYITVCSKFRASPEYKFKGKVQEESEKEVLDIQTNISQALQEFNDEKTGRIIKKALRRIAKNAPKATTPVEGIKTKENEENDEKMKAEKCPLEDKNSKFEEKLKIKIKKKKTIPVEGSKIEESEEKEENLKTEKCPVENMNSKYEENLISVAGVKSEGSEENDEKLKVEKCPVEDTNSNSEGKLKIKTKTKETISDEGIKTEGSEDKIEEKLNAEKCPVEDSNCEENLKIQTKKKETTTVEGIKTEGSEDKKEEKLKAEKCPVEDKNSNSEENLIIETKKKKTTFEGIKTEKSEDKKVKTEKCPVEDRNSKSEENVKIETKKKETISVEGFKTKESEHKNEKKLKAEKCPGEEQNYKSEENLKIETKKTETTTVEGIKTEGSENKKEEKLKAEKCPVEDKNSNSEGKLKIETKKKEAISVEGIKIEESEDKKEEKLKAVKCPVEDKISKCEENLKIEIKEEKVKSVEDIISEYQETSKVKPEELELEYSNAETLPGLKNNLLTIENTAPNIRNKLLEEHLLLKEENEKLRKENLKLKEEYERLKGENEKIMDVGREVQKLLQGKL